ncbi:MAG TPA: hypothetical protein VN765_15015 [Candidatus Acidoferrum sp.]|nr:hypothetical protein [Candidatus Acidoferrum sp.]
MLVEAIEEEILQPDDIIRWADNIIMAAEKPPIWVIELSTTQSPLMIDFASRLRTQASAQLPVSRRIQIIVLAYNTGLLSLPDTLSRLFRVTMDRGMLPAVTDPLDRQLVDALCDWDQQDDLDVIEPPLRARLTELFREYLANADDIAAILPWKLAKAV